MNTLTSQDAILLIMLMNITFRINMAPEHSLNGDIINKFKLKTNME
jgi:hypothetical protein